MRLPRTRGPLAVGIAAFAAAIGGTTIAAPVARAQGWDWRGHPEAQGWDWQGHPGSRPWADETWRRRPEAEWYRPGGRWYRFGGAGYPAWRYRPGGVVAWSAPSYQYQYQYRPGYSESYSYVETVPHGTASTTIYRKRSVAAVRTRPAAPHVAAVAKAPVPATAAVNRVHTATVVKRAQTTVVERRIHTVTVVHPPSTVAVAVPSTQEFVERVPPRWVGPGERGFGGDRPAWRPGPRWQWGY